GGCRCRAGRPSGRPGWRRHSRPSGRPGDPSRAAPPSAGPGDPRPASLPGRPAPPTAPARTPRPRAGSGPRTHRARRRLRYQVALVGSKTPTVVGATTVSVTAAALVAAFAPGVELATEAELMSGKRFGVPGGMRTTTVTVAVPPAGTVPR